MQKIKQIFQVSGVILLLLVALCLMGAAGQEPSVPETVVDQYGTEYPVIIINDKGYIDWNGVLTPIQ